jgi:hypothetical protein
LPSFRIEIPVASSRYRRTILVEYERKKLTITRCVVAFEVEIDGQRYQVVRYDNAHGGFHRHLPGLPEPSDERVDIGHVAPNEWVRYALDEIRANYQTWGTIVLRSAVVGTERKA